MANLQKFSEDEQLVVILTAGVSFLTDKLAEATPDNKMKIRNELAYITGRYASRLSQDEIQQILNDVRGNFRTSKLEEINRLLNSDN